MTYLNEKINRVVQKFEEFQTIPRTIPLIDIDKAFDRIWHKGLLSIYYKFIWNWGIRLQFG